MKVDYRKKFLKELARIPSGPRSKMEHFVFEDLPKANSIFELGIVKQMKGYPSYYKVRFGSYRIGFIRFHRKQNIIQALAYREEFRGTGALHHII